MPNHPSSLFHFAMCGLSASRTILPAGLAGVSGHGLALSPGGAHVIGSLPSEVAHGKRLRTCERSRNEPSPDRRGFWVQSSYVATASTGTDYDAARERLKAIMAKPDGCGAIRP